MAVKFPYADVEGGIVTFLSRARPVRLFRAFDLTSAFQDRAVSVVRLDSHGERPLGASRYTLDSLSNSPHVHASAEAARLHLRMRAPARVQDHDSLAAGTRDFHFITLRRESAASSTLITAFNGTIITVER